MNNQTILERLQRPHGKDKIRPRRIPNRYRAGVGRLDTKRAKGDGHMEYQDRDKRVDSSRFGSSTERQTV